MKKILFTLPQANTVLADSVTQIVQKIKSFSTFFQTDYQSHSPVHSSPTASRRKMFSLPKFNNFFKNKKSYFLPIAVIVILFVGISYLTLKGTSATPSGAVGSDGRVEIKPAKAEQEFSKTFEFPLRDDKGKEVSRLKYQIQNIELRDEIVVKGKRATAIKGRTFLIVNLRVTNDYQSAIEINTRDYVRLSVNNSKERLAADIHNDPVEIQPISTKETRLGFPINDSDNDLKLFIGEINGKKEELKLNLK